MAHDGSTGHVALRGAPIVGALVVLAAALGALPEAARSQAESGTAPQLPPPRAIPGITAEDQFPTACVGCHVVYTQMNRDERLSTLIGAWAEHVDPELLALAKTVWGPSVTLRGVHPRIDAAHMDIPNGCFVCHAGDADSAVPLVPLLHSIHLGTGGEAVFLRVFQGECTHCHKLDKATGQWSVPSAREE